MTFLALVGDTETNGLSFSRLIPLKRQPKVTEVFLALVDLDVGPEPLWEIDSLINPGSPLSAEITKITGIDDEILKDAPTWPKVAPLVRAGIEGAPRAIFHNASFDVELIDMEFERDGETLKWPPILCTVEQTIHILGHRLTLQGLHEYLFGERFREAHRAKNDVMALVRCCVELRKRGEL